MPSPFDKPTLTDEEKAQGITTDFTPAEPPSKPTLTEDEIAQGITTDFQPATPPSGQTQGQQPENWVDAFGEQAGEVTTDFTPDLKEHKIEQLMKLSDEERLQHAAKNPDDFEAAYEADKRASDSKNWEDNISDFVQGAGTAIAGAPQMFWDMGRGAFDMVANAYDSLASDSTPVQAKADAELLMAQQQGEANLGNMVNAATNKLTRMGASAVGEDKLAEELRKTRFYQRVKHSKDMAQLQSGRPLDDTLIPTIFNTKPSEDYSPEVLKTIGAQPVDTEKVARIASFTDPMNVALEIVPQLKGAQFLGGAATKMLGKTLQIPARVMEFLPNQLGRVMKGNSGTALGFALGETIVTNPAAAAKIAAAAGAAKGLQGVGRILEAAGAERITGKPSIFTEALAKARRNGQLPPIGAFAAQKGGKAVADALTGAIGFAPVNALTSDTYKQAGEMTGTAASFGAAMGALQSMRPFYIEAIRPILQQEGKASMERVTETGRKSAQFIETLPDAYKNLVYQMMGFMQGTKIDGKRHNIYLLPKADYAAALGVAPDHAHANTRGWFNDASGNTYVNGEYLSRQSPSELAHTLGHESGGHAVMAILQASGAKGGAIYDSLIRTAKKTLYKNGNPTPEFQKFLDNYNEKMGDGSKLVDQKQIDEFIAETAGQIIANQGIAEFAIPKNLYDKINDAVGHAFMRMLGVDDRLVGGKTKFDRTEVAAMNEEVRNALFQVAGIKVKDTAQQQAPEFKPQQQQQTKGAPAVTPNFGTGDAAAAGKVAYEQVISRAKDPTKPAVASRALKARRDAILKAIESEPNGPKLKTDEHGFEYVEGDLDLNNPAHVELLDAIGALTPEVAQALPALQQSKGQIVRVRYRGAHSKAAGDATDVDFGMDQRRIEYSADPADKRTAGTIHHKAVIPIDVTLTKVGEPVVNVWTLDNILYNADNAFRHVDEKGLDAKIPDFYPKDKQARQEMFVQDFLNMVKNYENGWRGDGQSPLQNVDANKFKAPTQGYQPIQIPRSRFEFITAMLGEPTRSAGQTYQAAVERYNAAALKAEQSGKEISKGVQRQMDNAREMYELSKAAGTLLDGLSGENNRWRQSLEQSGFNFNKETKSPFEKLLARHVMEVGKGDPLTLQEGDSPTVRPTADFDADPAVLGAEGIPNPKAVKGNFMPDESAGAEALVEAPKTPKEKARFRTLEKGWFMPDDNNLVAAHNLSESNLRHVLKMGGIPVPSLAVIRTDRSTFDSFGEITLVAKSHLVDPRNKDNKVFNADVYSPRYPEYETQWLNKSKAYDKLEKLASKAPQPWSKELSRFENLTIGREGLQESFKRNSDYAKLAWAVETGKALPELKSDDRYLGGTMRYELNNLVRENGNEFSQWVDRFFEQNPPKTKERIFKGFTQMGDRRYASHTLETVAKILKQKLKDGEGFDYGVGSIRANNAKQFRNIDQIKQSRDSIVPKEEMEAFKEQVDAEFFALAEKYGKDDGFRKIDGFSDDLKAIAQGGKENAQWIAKRYPEGVPQEMRDFLAKLKDMPTEYFEAKIQRIVQLHEFEGAAVPKGFDPQLKFELERRGLDVVEYDKDNKQSLQKAVKQVADSRKASFMPAEVAGAENASASTKERASKLWKEKGIESPFFRKWFGDSKVVDGDGKPIVVYHGTNSNFTSFDPNKATEGGFFFSSSKESASGFGNRIMESYLSIKNPLVIDGKTLPKEHSVEDIESIIEKAVEQGNDGVIIKSFSDYSDSASDAYIVFDAEQIKSATGNIGTFDKTNSDIRFMPDDKVVPLDIPDADIVMDDIKRAVQKNKLGETMLFPAKLGIPVEKWESVSGDPVTFSATLPINDIKLGREELPTRRFPRVVELLQDGFKSEGATPVSVVPSKEKGKFVVSGDGNHRALLVHLYNPEASIPVEVTMSKADYQKSKGSFMPSETTDNGFYSQLERTVDEKMPNSAPMAQALAIVRNSGIKPEELKWSDVDGAIKRIAKENSGKVPKEALLAYLRDEGAVKFKEVTLGENQIEDAEQITREIAYKYNYDVEYDAQNEEYNFYNNDGIIEDWKDIPEDMKKELELAQDQTDRVSAQPKYSQYSLAGGDNYREVVLTMPEKLEPFDKSKVQIERKRDSVTQGSFRIVYDGQELSPWYGDSGGSGEHGFLTDSEAIDVAKKLYLTGDKFNNVKGESKYTSSHFTDIPDYVAHMRVDERPDAQGRRGLFIQEIQSDRHQQGREKGYTETIDPSEFSIVKKEGPYGGYSLEARGKSVGIFDTMEQAQEAMLAPQKSSGTIADAPFRKSWPLQMFKRALRDAVESGKKWVGWTEGQVHTDRWGTERIEWAKQPDGSWLVNAKSQHGGNAGGVNLEAEANAKGLNKQNSKTVRTLDELKSVIEPSLTEGQDVDKLGPKLWEKMQSSDSGVSHPRKEGFEGFYDTIMPNEVGAYVKKWGAKVEKGEIDIRKPEDNSWYEEPMDEHFKPIWKVEITPEMRESVEKGQPKFMPDEIGIDSMPEKFAQDKNGNITWGGKQPKDWTPEEFEEFGKAFGVENVGPLSPLKNLGKPEGFSGKEIIIPNGFDGKFTFFDLLWLKANPYGPEDMPESMHAKLTDKLARTMEPTKGDKLESLNRLLFGLLSPNTALLPNELGYAKLKFQSIEDVREFAKLADENTSKEERSRIDKEIRKKYGLAAGGKKKGIAVGANLSSMADLARQWLKDPDWFTKKESESWHTFVDRISSQVRGLGTKTASFGGVWQDPAMAMVSAMDRHMARRFSDEILQNPALRNRFESVVVSSFNKGIVKSKAAQRSFEKAIKKADGDQKKIDAITKKFNAKMESLPPPTVAKAKSLDDVISQSEAFGQDAVRRFINDAAFAAMSARKGKYLNKKGDINPRLPETLKGVEFIETPKDFQVMSDIYKAALEINERKATELGIAVFPAQWTLWDRIRGRVEPHEIMFPNYYKLPKMGNEQIQEVMKAHTKAGYSSTGGKMKPTENPASLAYFMPEETSPSAEPSKAAKRAEMIRAMAKQRKATRLRTRVVQQDQDDEKE